MFHCTAPSYRRKFVIGAECVEAAPPLPAIVGGQPLIREPYVLGTHTK
jgi:hypothetical protein